MNSRRVGFTLTEVMCVAAILMILGALAYPVFTAAKESALETQCASNLRQRSLGLQLYRQEFEGLDVPAHPEQMGLPDGAPGQGEYWLKREIAACTSSRTYPSGAPKLFPRGDNALWPSTMGGRLERSEAEIEEWISFVEKHGLRTPLLADYDHQRIWPANPLTIQRVRAATLDGGVRFQQRRGDATKMSWWLREEG